MERHIARLTIILLLFGCGGISTEAPRKKDSNKGGLLVMNQFQGFSTLHPPSSYENSSAQLGSQIYETLFNYNPETLELNPLLVSEWEVNEESTQFTLTLRDDIYFHDDPCFKKGLGRKLEAADVIYCLKVLCSNSSINSNDWLLTNLILGAQEFHSAKLSPSLDELKGIQKLSDDKLLIELNEPYVEFLHLLSHYSTSIYPKEAYDTYKGQVSNHLVGTGPFKMKTLRPAEICVLERNENYWGVDDEGNSLPYLIGVKIGFVKSGEELITSIRQDILDLTIDADIVEGGDKIAALLIEKKELYEEMSTQELETVFLSFLNSEGVFSDVRVRQAFSFALDKQAIVENALALSAEAGEYGLVPPGFNSYPYQDVKSHSRDIAGAKELLAEAGFPEGTDFPVVTLQIQNRYRDVVVAQEIQRQILEHLGVSLSITTLPREQHFERTEKAASVLWLDNWIADYRSPDSFLNLMLSSNTPENGDSYLNTYRYTSEAYDELIKEATRIKDKAARYDKYAQADQMMVVDDAAIVPVFYEKSMVIKAKRVKNLSPPLFGRFDLRRVYIEE